MIPALTAVDPLRREPNNQAFAAIRLKWQSVPVGITGDAGAFARQHAADRTAAPHDAAISRIDAAPIEWIRKLMAIGVDSSGCRCQHGWKIQSPGVVDFQAAEWCPEFGNGRCFEPWPQPRMASRLRASAFGSALAQTVHARRRNQGVAQFVA